MTQRQVGNAELIALLCAEVGHRRVIGLLGASLVCGLVGAAEWPEMGETLRGMGYSTAAIYKIREDFRRCARRLEEAEGQPCPWERLVERLRTADGVGLTRPVTV